MSEQMCITTVSVFCVVGPRVLWCVFVCGVCVCVCVFSEQGELASSPKRTRDGLNFFSLSSIRLVSLHKEVVTSPSGKGFSFLRRGVLFHCKKTRKLHIYYLYRKCNLLARAEFLLARASIMSSIFAHTQLACTQFGDSNIITLYI